MSSSRELWSFSLGIEGLSRPEVNPYGPPVAPEEAPEAITQAVASLPPEQMFELMKQMKVPLTFCLESVVFKSYCALFLSRCSK